MLMGVMSTRVRKLLKLSLTALLIVILVPRIDVHALGHAFSALRGVEVLALALFVCLQQGLLTKRFAIILGGFAAREGYASTIRLRDLLIDQQIGTAYNIVLPSTVGGDVMRGLRAQQRLGGAGAGRAAVAWSAVLLDRLIGLLALVLAPLTGLLLGLGPASGALLRVTAATVMVLLPLVVFAGRLSRLLASLARSRSERIYELATQISDVLELGVPAVRWRALFWSLAYQLSVYGFFHVAAFAFGIPLSVAFTAIWIGLPLAFVLSTLPVTIGGLGLRESLFVGILGLCGVDAASALAFSILWSAQGLVTAAAGIIALWCERSPSPLPSAE
ncbi:MAG: rane protein of unknown function [Myxococcaceae bacterium]|nr:rane protein of unknown function [Myxococcaceae bacterium]